MNLNRAKTKCRVLNDQSGQIVPWVALLMVLFLGMSALVVDIGRAMVCYRQLQSAADAAAMAGAYALPDSSYSTIAKQYGATSTGSNYTPMLAGAIKQTESITAKCLTTLEGWGEPCAGAAAANAVFVTETATIPTYFAGIVGMPTMNLVVTSAASMRGEVDAKYNVAIVLDTTSSMGQSDTDANCGNTREFCALEGVQTLLGLLTPCTAQSTSSNCIPFDQASLLTFPPMQANTVSDDTACPTSSPQIVPYIVPTAGSTWVAPNPASTAGTYQITGYLSDYSSTNQKGGALDSSSPLVIATGGGTGTKNHPCQGLQTPGGDGTYLAGAIYSAASSLVAQQALYPGSKNALIVLSDGAANTSKMSGTLTKTGVYPSLVDQCQQSVTAAQWVTNNLPDTTVYTIAYGASNQGGKAQCTTDPTLDPCTELQEMASTPADFYSDATASQNKGQCISAVNPTLSLAGIFKQVANSFTKPRLIPINTP
jgi:Flp pilus assembly protein TadG